MKDNKMMLLVGVVVVVVVAIAAYAAGDKSLFQGNLAGDTTCSYELVADSRNAGNGGEANLEPLFKKFTQVFGYMKRVADGRDNPRCVYAFKVFDDPTGKMTDAAVCTPEGVTAYRPNGDVHDNNPRKLFCRAADEDGNSKRVEIWANESVAHAYNVARKAFVQEQAVGGKVAVNEYNGEFEFFTIEQFDRDSVPAL